MPPAKSQPLKINAGGISVSLPGSAMPAAVAVSELMNPQQFAAMKQMMRMKEPAAALAEVDRMLMRSPNQPDLLMRAGPLPENGSSARSRGVCVRGVDSRCLLDVADAAELFRQPGKGGDVLSRLSKGLARSADGGQAVSDGPAGERMLRHDKEAVAMLEQAMEAVPADRLMSHLHDKWSESLEPEAPPAAAVSHLRGNIQRSRQPRPSLGCFRFCGPENSHFIRRFRRGTQISSSSINSCLICEICGSLLLFPPKKFPATVTTVPVPRLSL